MLLWFISSYLAVPLSGQYSGYSLYRISGDHDQELVQLSGSSSNIDIWSRQNGAIHVLAAPNAKELLSKYNPSVLVDNVQDLIDEELNHSMMINKRERAAAVSMASRGANEKHSSSLTADELFSDYRDASVYNSFIGSLPNVTSFQLGESFEKRPIMAFKFGTGSKHIIFQGGIHAREWISPAVTTYLTNFLTSDEPRAVALRSKFTFTVIPVLNQDGYAFSRLANGDRMWRKNRQPNQGSRCIGVDLNRNYEFKFGGPGSSGNPCDQTYRGTAPYSTPEAPLVPNYIKSLGAENVLSYTDIHSYAQQFIVFYFNTVSYRTKMRSACQGSTGSSGCSGCSH